MTHIRDHLAPGRPEGARLSDRLGKCLAFGCYRHARFRQFLQRGGKRPRRRCQSNCSGRAARWRLPERPALLLRSSCTARGRQCPNTLFTGFATRILFSFTSQNVVVSLVIFLSFQNARQDCLSLRTANTDVARGLAPALSGVPGPRARAGSGDKWRWRGHPTGTSETGGTVKQEEQPLLWARAALSARAAMGWTPAQARGPWSRQPLCTAQRPPLRSLRTRARPCLLGSRDGWAPAWTRDSLWIANECSLPVALASSVEDDTHHATLLGMQTPPLGADLLNRKRLCVSQVTRTWAEAENTGPEASLQGLTVSTPPSLQGMLLRGEFNAPGTAESVWFHPHGCQVPSHTIQETGTA